MSRFTYATVCSGVECCSLALNAAPPTQGAWQPVFFSEIAPFPCALLAHRYPGVPNLGDMTKLKATESTITNGTTNIRLHGRLDLLSGGTPCQDFSTAGKRAGAAQGSGTRSSLCWDYLRLVAKLRPRVILWENVLGCLSTNGGGDFSRFVAEIALLGYGVAWRVLDCQYTRVDRWPMAIPQRRNRVWLVGCADGDIDGAAKILFEPKSLLGDTPPRRETRKAATHCPSSSAGECYPTIIARTQQLSNQEAINSNGLIVAPTIGTNFGSNPNSCAPIEGRIILANKAYDKWEQERTSSTIKHSGGIYGGGSESIIIELNHGTLHDTARCLQGDHDSRICDSANIVASVQTEKAFSIAENIIGRKPENGGNGLGFNEDVCHTLNATGVHGVAEANSRNVVSSSQTASCAKSYNDAELNQDLLISSPIGFIGGAGAKASTTCAHEEVSPAKTKGQSVEVCIPHTSTVRRLTPLECERLMGYPDNYTRIPYRGKPAEQCPDGPRYESCGNGWAINCARWILLGIHRYLVEQYTTEQEDAYDQAQF